MISDDVVDFLTKWGDTRLVDEEVSELGCPTLRHALLLVPGCKPRWAIFSESLHTTYKPFDALVLVVVRTRRGPRTCLTSLDDATPSIVSALEYIKRDVLGCGDDDAFDVVDCVHVTREDMQYQWPDRVTNKP